MQQSASLPHAIESALLTQPVPPGTQYIVVLYGLRFMHVLLELQQG